MYVLITKKYEIFPKSLQLFKYQKLENVGVKEKRFVEHKL